MKKQCTPKVNQNMDCSSVRARRSDGGERVTNAGKTRGAFSPRFFFPRQFFSRALLSERDMISFKANHCKAIGINPVGSKSDMGNV